MKKVYILETWTDEGWEMDRVYSDPNMAITVLQDGIDDEVFHEYGKRDQKQGLLAYIQREDDMVTTARIQWRVVN